MRGDIREMFLIPKETFFSCMKNSSKHQQDRVNDVNVEQLNVSCGPLFAGIKTGVRPQEFKKPDGDKKSQPDFNDQQSVESQIAPTVKKKNITQPLINNVKKEKIVTISEKPGRKAELVSAKNSRRSIDPMSGQLIEAPSGEKRAKPDRKLQNTGINNNIQSAEKTVLQQIMAQYENKKRRNSTPVVADLTADEKKQTYDPPKSLLFSPPSLRPEPRFSSDFAQSLKRQQRENPEIRLNSTTLPASDDEIDSLPGASGDNEVFEAETKKLPNKTAEKSVEDEIRGINPKNMFKNIFPLYQKGDNSSAEEQINKSIEKTLRTKNDQEKKEIERSRSKTSSPMRVSTLASRYETSAMHIPQANTSNLANSRKKYVHLGSLGVSQFYADKEKSKKSGARQARTRSETNMEKHLKRREKIAKGIDIPNQDTPKRVRYEHQL